MMNFRLVRLFPFSAVILTLWLHICIAIAQPAPGVEKLRLEISELQKRSPTVPQGAFESAAYQLDVAERIAKSFPTQAAQWQARAAKLIARLRQGTDPFPEQRGAILMRGYQSPISSIRQGYAIYIPPGYDAKKAYPLMIVMHGGSANGNLFLGVVLGNNMNWKEYSNHLWDDFRPQWSPDWIVVAPDGYGQIMWRWMGEQDVLSVIDDVQKHYHVDSDRVVLGGLSNGGVGAYNIGLRHAWRFAAVTAMAGAPSWLQYAGGPMLDEERATLRPQSGLELAENAINTDFRYYHGRRDAGPMRPGFVQQFTTAIKKLGVPFRETWFDVGHDLLYLVHARGRIFERLANTRRDRHPTEVRVVTGDYRANRQHWVTVTRIERFPELARARAVARGNAVTIETSNILALSLDLNDAPLESAKQSTSPNTTRIVIDGSTVYDGSRQALGQVAKFAKSSGVWKVGALPSATQVAFEKQPGSSGPITDAYYGAMIHVYGTAHPEHTEALKRAAERGSRGWPLWLWNYRQRVASDTEVTEQMMRDAHLVLYGTAGDNRVLERIKDRLPIRVESDAVAVAERRFAGKSVGTKFIHPNPLSPQRYVIVQAGVTTAAVMAGHNLPDFLPDYVVYDANATRTRARLIFERRGRPLALGFFDRFWTLPVTHEIAGDESPPDPSPAAAQVPDSNVKPLTPASETKFKAPGRPQVARTPRTLPIPPAPPIPPIPERFLAPETDPAGRVARLIAQRVHGFFNYRAYIPGATWTVDPGAVWSIRPEQECLQAMRQQGIEVHLHKAPVRMPIATPVQIKGPIAGVNFRHGHAGPLVVSCELATRLPVLAKVVSKQGVRTVIVASAFRDKPQTSFHTMGLGLDLSQFITDDGPLSIWGDFMKTPTSPTCDAPPAKSPKANALRAIACDLAKTHVYSSVLTPNYNEGHRDHYHIDIRPDDPRFFVR